MIAKARRTSDEVIPNASFSPKGMKRKLSILDAAIALLVAEGGESFSMNKVANRANISLGNLQYYFPKKTDLIQGMLRNMLDIDLAKLEAVARDTDNDALSRFTVLIDSLLESNNNIEDAKVVTHLWSVSLYNQELNEIHDNWYSEYRVLMMHILMELNPKRSKAQLHSITVLIISLIEGSCMLTGAGRIKHPELRNYESDLRNTLIDLAVS